MLFVQEVMLIALIWHKVSCTVKVTTTRQVQPAVERRICFWH